MGIDNSFAISGTSPDDAFLKLVGCLWSVNESVRAQAALALSKQAEQLDYAARAQAVHVLKDSLNNGVLKHERRVVRAAVSAIKFAPETDSKVTLAFRACVAIRSSKHVDSLNEEARDRAIEVLKRALAEGVLEPFDLWRALKCFGVKRFNDEPLIQPSWFARAAKFLMRSPPININPFATPAVVQATSAVASRNSMPFANIVPVSAWPASAQRQIARQRVQARA